MSFCLRHAAVLGLLVGSACFAAAGCSSDNKKQVRFVGDAGAGGEAGAPAPAAAGAPPEATGAMGGGIAPGEAGQGGAPEAAGAAGEAGASSAGTGGVIASGGSGGVVASGGSAGSGGAATTCQPTGDAYALALDIPEGNAPKVCRGALVTNGFT